MKQTEKITIRVSPDTKAAINLHIQNTNYQSESDFIRNCIDNELAGHTHIITKDMQLDLEIAVYNIDTALTAITTYMPTPYVDNAISLLTESREKLWKYCHQN